MAEHSQKTAAVVYNPIKVDLKTIRASVLRHQDDAGWGPTRYYETSKEDPGGAVTATALADGASMVIAAGGSSDLLASNMSSS